MNIYARDSGIDMQNYNALVINLKKSIDRRQYIMKHFSKIGIVNYVFLEGIDGKNLKSNYIQKIYKPSFAIKKHGRELSRGEIGCALSHIECYKHIVKNNIASSFIFEDDCLLNEDTVNNMNTIVEKLDASKEAIIVLLTLADYVKQRSNCFGFNKISNKYHIKKIYKAGLAHGYYINNHAAKKMLQEFKYIYQPIDTWKMIKKIPINIFCVYPYCVSTYMPHSSNSTIKSPYLSDEGHKIKKSLPSSIAKLIRDKILRTYGQKIVNFITGIKLQKHTW